MSTTTKATDLTAEFSDELFALLDRWKDRPGFSYQLVRSPEFARIEPEYDPATDQSYRRRQRGPKTEFRLTIRDAGKQTA